MTIYRDVVDRLKNAYSLRSFVLGLPDGEQRACVELSYVLDAPDRFERLSQEHPQHRDELVQIAAATIGDGWELLKTALRLYGVEWERSQELLEPLLRMYRHAPENFEDYGLSVLHLIRSTMRAVEHALTPVDALPSKVVRALETIVGSPPPAAHRHDYYRFAHTVYSGILAYNHSEDPRWLHTIADSIDNWARPHDVSTARPVLDDDVTAMLSLARTNTALLPIVNRLIRLSPGEWKGNAARFYWAAFARTPDAFPCNETECGWTGATLFPRVSDALDKLFEQREFTHDAIDAVFQSLVENMGDDEFSAWMDDALNDAYKTSGVSRNLIRGFAVRMPEKAEHYVRLAVQSITDNGVGWERFSDWIAGRNAEDDHNVRDAIPQRVRKLAQWEMARVFDQFSEQRAFWRGSLARRLATAVLGLNPETVSRMTTDQAVLFWEVVSNCLREPQRLLETAETDPTMLHMLTGATPLTPRDKWREYDKSRRVLLERAVCHES